ncbi:hypothetical protein VP06_29960 [Methylobacterium aquaticum]|uniref:LamG domain-containing protein n=2 Tax=Methylobacterium aquaticum TaxID=270351 RepID=A0A0J6RY07_9HYPH|nr:hypothetical protein VP06_29960 [Methylobacterium aquaticum]
MTQIKAKPSLVSWHRMTPDNLNPGTTQQGAPIVDVLNLRGTGGTFSNFTTDASRPQYANGRLNGRPGIRFDGVDDFLVQFNKSWVLGAPWTMAVLFQADPSVAIQTPLAAYDSSAVISGILQNGDAVSCRHGNADLTMSAPRGQATFVMLSSDTGVIRARINGVEGGPVATNNVQPTAAPRMGSLDNGSSGLLKGVILDVLFFSDDLLGHDRATASLVERYMTAPGAFAMPFTPLQAF